MQLRERALAMQYKKGIVPTYVRMPEDLHKKVTDHAKKNVRSWNAEVTFILQEHFKMEESQEEVKKAE
jgi:hypothetical protein